MRRGREASHKRMDWELVQEKQWSEENMPRSEALTILD